MNPAFAVVSAHLKAHPIPGAAFSLNGDAGCYGRLWHTPDAPKVSLSTVWDLASLTKVLVTVPLLLKLWAAGRLDLEAPLVDALPTLRGQPLETATVTQLATHTSGLAALSKLRFWGLAREAALQRALAEPRPETGIVYSDQGYLVLTALLEHIYGARIDDVAERELFSPVGAALTYHPDPQDCACTEFDETRAALLRGTVHDENTRALDGVSGHAGLFGSLLEVERYVTALMRGQVLPAAALERMAIPVVRSSNDARAFGWVLRHDGWLGGDRAPKGALGHTGFTGTGVWFSLETGESHILLTNRVCPSRDQPSEIAALRRNFNDAAWRCSICQ